MWGLHSAGSYKTITLITVVNTVCTKCRKSHLHHQKAFPHLTPSYCFTLTLTIRQTASIYRREANKLNWAKQTNKICNMSLMFCFSRSPPSAFYWRAGAQLINTNCSAAHNRQALSCKMAQEYDAFIHSGKKWGSCSFSGTHTHTHTWTHTHTQAVSDFKLVCCRWFCHVDDDNYLNVDTLLKLLSQYSHTQDVYLGRPSLERPIQATEQIGPGQAVSGLVEWAVDVISATVLLLAHLHECLLLIDWWMSSILTQSS